MSTQIETEDSDSPKAPSGCCGGLRADFSLPFFGVKDTDGNIIDVQESFAPKPKFRTLTVKTICAGWALQSMIQTIVETDEAKSFFLAYLTHWSLVLAIAYLLCSWIVSLLKEPSQPPEDGRPGFFLRLTWSLFSIAAVLELTATLLYWVLEYDAKDGAPKYTSLMNHGIIMLLVWLEGLVLNRIPVRARHLLFVMIASVSYVVWTIIHSQTNIGNPQKSDEDPDTDDDAIYGSLNWNENLGKSAIIACLAVFVLVPLEFLFLWYLSTWSCFCRCGGSRRFYEEESLESKPEQSCAVAGDSEACDEEAAAVPY